MFLSSVSPGYERLGVVVASCETAPLGSPRYSSNARCLETDLVRSMGDEAADRGGTHLAGLACWARGEGTEMEVREHQKHLFDVLVEVAAFAGGTRHNSGPGTPVGEPYTVVISLREQVACAADVVRAPAAP